MSDRNLGLLSNGVGLDKDCLNPKALFFNESLTSDVLSTPGKKISSKSELDAGKKSASVSTLLKILSANTYKILCETAKQVSCIFIDREFIAMRCSCRDVSFLISVWEQ